MTGELTNAEIDALEPGDEIEIERDEGDQVVVHSGTISHFRDGLAGTELVFEHETGEMHYLDQLKNKACNTVRRLD